MLLYDNLDDVKAKLAGTYCYYDGKMVMVREVGIDFDPSTQKEFFLLAIQFLNGRTPIKRIRLEDPLFNYMRFNLGYSNHGHSSVWWYRIPMKQYHQGLRSGQLKRKATNHLYIGHTEFAFCASIADMLENKYPSFEESEKLVKSCQHNISAFNVDFACTWDNIHKDLIVEYKGKAVGSLINRNNFNLIDEYKHLTEALKEAVA